MNPLVRCYNCNRMTNHHSHECPQRQSYSRCPSCNRVVRATGNHKPGCNNIEFLSTFIGSHTCYNCNEVTMHESKDCPLEPKLSRCDECNKVCASADNHAIDCTQRMHFISRPVEHNEFRIESFAAVTEYSAQPDNERSFDYPSQLCESTFYGDPDIRKIAKKIEKEKEMDCTYYSFQWKTLKLKCIE